MSSNQPKNTASNQYKKQKNIQMIRTIYIRKVTGVHSKNMYLQDRGLIGQTQFQSFFFSWANQGWERFVWKTNGRSCAEKASGSFCLSLHLHSFLISTPFFRPTWMFFFLGHLQPQMFLRAFLTIFHTILYNHALIDFWVMKCSTTANGFKAFAKYNCQILKYRQRIVGISNIFLQLKRFSCNFVSK